MSKIRPSILNPTTGQIVAEQKPHTAADLNCAVAGARKAQVPWYAGGLARRSRIIRGWPDESCGRNESREAPSCSSTNSIAPELVVASL